MVVVRGGGAALVLTVVEINTHVVLVTCRPCPNHFVYTNSFNPQTTLWGRGSIMSKMYVFTFYYLISKCVFL